MKVGVAWAGLLGRLLAFELARAGHQVAVFDPAADAQAPGAAGWTAPACSVRSPSWSAPTSACSRWGSNR